MCESVNPYTGNQSDKTTLGATVQVGYSSILGARVWVHRGGTAISGSSRGNKNLSYGYRPSELRSSTLDFYSRKTKMWNVLACIKGGSQRFISQSCKDLPLLLCCCLRTIIGRFDGQVFSVLNSALVLVQELRHAQRTQFADGQDFVVKNEGVAVNSKDFAGLLQLPTDTPMEQNLYFGPPDRLLFLKKVRMRMRLPA
ncbi:hypothetical protein OUZ56_026961 [Daphnia magna]|uniref:Uncharacterized protein n=1 Tax=Daphnia magna TaxID=35525 RepID=A0ABQ9ZPC8_9CRUS|nr:hypothetical protein OUZ56_026961 [Daphnia magna]